MSKRTGRYGDPPRTDAPAFGERKGGAPLPLAGKNLCEVRWPRFRPGDGPAGDVLRAELTLEARGVIRAAQKVVGVSEADATWWVTVTPVDVTRARSRGWPCSHG